MNVIEAKDLHKTYGANTPNPVFALRGVSFAIAKGEFAAIMGHSGSGKSTLMNLLGCLDRPSSGEFLLNGQDVSKKSRRELAHIRGETIGFVFQSFHLMARMTAKANCELPMQYTNLSGKERRTRAENVLKRVGLGEKLDRRPTELSGGQQQRVAIARALVNKPALLLADEPTGNLDTRTGLEILALLQELNRDGLTVVLVTHEPDVAACARRVLYMRDGLLAKTTLNENPPDARKLLEEYVAQNTSTQPA